MIIKGVSVAGAKRLALHLTRTDTNERAEIMELRGVVAEDLSGALQEMGALAGGTRTTKPFYHSSINILANERLTGAQWTKAIDRLEDTLGLSGQARVVVRHVKEGREHYHVVWSRIDLDRMAAISDSHNYRKHEEVARALEREFGLERVQGAHIEREDKPRPARTPSHAEMLQSSRTGLSPQEAKERITEIWNRCDSGKALEAALWQEGFVLARGDRRDFVVIDQMGGTHSLARRVDGANAKAIRERMGDLDPGQLPSVRDAKQIQQARLEQDAARERPGDQRVESVRVDEEQRSKRSVGLDADWTAKGGMVEQQRSAMDWVEKTQAEKKSRTEQSERGSEQGDVAEATQRRREALLRQFGREIEQGLDDGRDIGDGGGPSR